MNVNQISFQTYARHLEHLRWSSPEPFLYDCIVDYIGRMTDQFAYNEYDRPYGKKF